MVILSLKENELYSIGAALMTHLTKDPSTLNIYVDVVKKIIPKIEKTVKKNSLKHLFNLFVAVHQLPIKQFTSKGDVL